MVQIMSLKNLGSLPWLCVGDFNEITQQAEKQGGRSWPHHQMQAFRDILDKCGFMDLDFVGFAIHLAQTLSQFYYMGKIRLSSCY